MENSLIMFYVLIVGVYSCLLFNIPDKNHQQMIALTVITMLLIYIGQQYMISTGKVRHGKNDSHKFDNSYKVASMSLGNVPSGNCKCRGKCNCGKQCNCVGKCNCGGNGGKLIEGFAQNDGFVYLKDNIKNEVNRVPKNMGEIVSGEGLIGPYDGKCLAANASGDDKYRWMKEPYDTDLLPSTGFVQQGSTGPLKDRISNDKYLNGPHLDGTQNTSESMFMFSKNKCSPGCCPSSFSCDGGCVCTTEKQREFISRGGVMPNNSGVTGV